MTDVKTGTLFFFLLFTAGINLNPVTNETSVSLCLGKKRNTTMRCSGSKSSDVKIREKMRSFVLKQNFELSHVGFEKADFSE